MTVGAPGTQGPAGTGVHGIGVSTPRAAAVAEATEGLAMLVHMPKGGMLRNGTLSEIVPTGIDEAMTLGFGSATNELGATPIVHCIIAPEVMNIPI